MYSIFEPPVLLASITSRCDLQIWLAYIMRGHGTLVQEMDFCCTDNFNQFLRHNLTTTFVVSFKLKLWTKRMNWNDKWKKKRDEWIPYLHEVLCCRNFQFSVVCPQKKSTDRSYLNKSWQDKRFQWINEKLIKTGFSMKKQTFALWLE